jgi:zinc protease
MPNGLRLLVRSDDAAPVASIVTHVRAGYFDEPDAVVGVSHVLEHMFFKGTERRGAGEIARATKAAGGYLNAGTIYDHTTYYTVLPSAALDLGLELQADALLHSTIDEEELRKELVVITEEVKRKLDNPSAMATEKLFEAMFDAHPMRRWRMGSPEALVRFTRSDVYDFYRSMYRGDNIVLVVSGDVDADHVIHRVESLYAELPPGGDERHHREEPPRTGPRLREMSGDLGHSYGEIGWRTPGTLHPDTPALDALSVILGQGRASRLYQGVRERGLASRIGSFNYTPTEIGVFGIGLECAPDRTAAALRAVWNEVRRIRDEATRPDELERVRTLLEARMLRRLETAEGRANLLAEWQALGDWRHAGTYLDQIRDLDAAAIRDVAAAYLDPDRITLLVYRPAAAPALGWSDHEIVAALDGGAPPSEPPHAAATQAGGPTDPGSVGDVGPPVADWRGAPAALVRSVHAEDGVLQYPLDGGRLVVKRRPHAPLVSMAICRSGGVTRETMEEAGITGLLMRTSLKGTATRSAERIAMESERLGGTISTSAGADLLSWSFTVPSANFADGLDLLSDVAFRSEFPDDEIERERAVALADLDRLRDDMHRYPIALMLKAAFDGHPYGHGPEDVEQALGRLARRDLRRWHTTALGEPWLFVVGDIEPDRVADAVADTWLEGSVEPAVLQGETARWPDSCRVGDVQRDRAQTAMAVAFPGPPRRHPDRIPLEVLSSAVSGLGNRLFEELRSRRSLAYTVSAYPIARQQAGAFVGYIATAVDRADEARAALLEELGGLRDEPPSSEELERARRYMIGSWQIQTQTNAAQLSQLASALMLGEGLAEVTEYESRVSAVTGQDVLAAAARWFDESRLVEGVVRGSARRAGDAV